MEQNLKIIREACWKANPEIMELKFGCEVKSGKSLLFLIFIDENGCGCYYNKTSFQIGDFSRATIFDEILGRPIRLADVLFAIRKNRHSVDDLAGMRELFGKIALKWVGVFPSEDDLSLQSEETLQFLASLLK